MPDRLSSLDVRFCQPCSSGIFQTLQDSLPRRKGTSIWWQVKRIPEQLPYPACGRQPPSGRSRPARSPTRTRLPFPGAQRFFVQAYQTGICIPSSPATRQTFCPPPFPFYHTADFMSIKSSFIFVNSAVQNLRFLHIYAISFQCKCGMLLVASKKNADAFRRN